MIRMRQKGIITIEFSFGFIVLIFTTFMILEIFHNIYITNITEYALRETIRETKNHQEKTGNSTFQVKLEEILVRDDSLWHFLIEKDKYELQSSYFCSYHDLINNHKSHHCNPVLAEITLTYHYIPMLFLVPNSTASIRRTVMVNIEHKGKNNNE